MSLIISGWITVYRSARKRARGIRPYRARPMWKTHGYFQENGFHIGYPQALFHKVRGNRCFSVIFPWITLWKVWKSFKTGGSAPCRFCSPPSSPFDPNPPPYANGTPANPTGSARTASKALPHLAGAAHRTCQNAVNRVQ